MRRDPRPLGDAFKRVLDENTPQTLLAEVQAVWAAAAGDAVARQAEPVAERDGVVNVACASATWAQELDLLQDRLRDRLNEALGEPRVQALRFTADRSRHQR